MPSLMGLQHARDHWGLHTDTNAQFLLGAWWLWKQLVAEPRTDFLPIEYFDDDCDLGDDDDWMDECGYVPGSGVCTLAGTEHCDWECPYNPCDPEGT